MFEITVWSLLDSYSGDSQTMEFAGEILPGTFEGVETLSPLSFELTLISTDDGIEAIVHNLKGKIGYEHDTFDVSIAEFARTFKTDADPLAFDDVKFVNKKNSSIDLTPVLREEIIMAVHY